MSAVGSTRQAPLTEIPLACRLTEDGSGEFESSSTASAPLQVGLRPGLGRFRGGRPCLGLQQRANSGDEILPGQAVGAQLIPPSRGKFEMRWLPG